MAKTRTGVSIASVGKALGRALSLLARRAYTEAELRKKLAGYPADEVEAAVGRLKAWGYLDDRAYAETFVRARRGRYGPRRLAGELRRRGVDEEIVAELVQDAGEVEAAARLLGRRWSRYRALSACSAGRDRGRTWSCPKCARKSSCPSLPRRSTAWPRTWRA